TFDLDDGRLDRHAAWGSQHPRLAGRIRPRQRAEIVLFDECFDPLNCGLERPRRLAPIGEALGRRLLFELLSREFIDSRAQVFGIVLYGLDHARQDEREFNLGHGGRRFVQGFWSQYFRTHNLSVSPSGLPAISADILLPQSDGAAEPIFAGTM